MPDDETHTGSLLERIITHLQKEYNDALRIQLTCEASNDGTTSSQYNNTGWWFCEGKKLTAEILLRKIGIDPEEKKIAAVGTVQVVVGTDNKNPPLKTL